MKDFDKDFDKAFERNEKMFATLFKIAPIMIVVSFLVGLMFFGGCGYIVYHFISKVW